MFRKHNEPEINKTIRKLAEYLLENGLDAVFRKKAKEMSVSGEDLDDLQNLFFTPPNESEIYSPEIHGLGGWLSSCQFAIFELIYCVGEDALPFIREIAWGEYDWTQANAIELLIRFAADGVDREGIVEEIKSNYPRIRHEAQLYTIQPLLTELDQNRELKLVFDALLEIADFKEAYEELT